MRVLVDLNVLLDVIQLREPHYPASARVLSQIVEGKVDGAVPGRTLTTIHYIVSRYAGRDPADEAINWILGDFLIVGEDKGIMLRARGLSMSDFEDAVVVAAAEAHRCSWIVTRNIADFERSPVPAATPEELLEHLTVA